MTKHDLTSSLTKQAVLPWENSKPRTKFQLNSQKTGMSQKKTYRKSTGNKQDILFCSSEQSQTLPGKKTLVLFGFTIFLLNFCPRVLSRCTYLNCLHITWGGPGFLFVCLQTSAWIEASNKKKSKVSLHPGRSRCFSYFQTRFGSISINQVQYLIFVNKLIQ